MRSEGNMRKTIEEEVEVNEEEVEWRTEGETQFEEQGDDFDPPEEGGDEPHGQNELIVRRGDVEGGQGPSHNEVDRSCEEG